MQETSSVAAVAIPITALPVSRKFRKRNRVSVW